MGKRFFEGTLPALVTAVERVNEKLERLAATDAAKKDAHCLRVREPSATPTAAADRQQPALVAP